jgi:hypothetical protein
MAAAHKQMLANQKAFWDEYVKHETDALDKNITMGRTGAGLKSAPSLIDTGETVKTNAVVEAQEKLKESLAHLTESEVAYKNAVATSTTEQSHFTAEMALKKKIVEDATTAERELNVQIGAESAAIKTLTPQVDANQAAMNQAAAAYNIAAQTKGEDTKALEALKKIYEEAKKTYDQTATTLAKLNSQREENIKTLSAEQQKTVDLAAAQAALLRAYDKTTTANYEKIAEELATYKQSIAAQLDYYRQRLVNVQVGSNNELAMRADFEGKILALEIKAKEQDRDDAAEVRKLADEEATYKKSIAQTIAYYQQRLAIIQASGVDTYDEAHALNQKILELDVQAYKDRVDAAATALQTIQEKEKGVLDDILTKHKSARDELKTVYDDIKNAYVQMVEQMVLKSTIMQGISDMFGALADGGSSALGGKKAGKDTGAGTFGSILGPLGSASSGPAAPSGTKNDPVFVEGSQALYSALTGTATGLHVGASDGSALPVALTTVGAGVGSSTSSDLTAGLALGLAAASSGGTGGGISSTPSVASIFRSLGGSSGGSTGIQGLWAPSGSAGSSAGTAGATPAGNTSWASGLMSTPIGGDMGSSWDPSAYANPTVGGAIGAAGMGATIGGVVGPALNNGSNDASAGGAVGGAAGMIAGTLIAGPVGGAVGTAVGSILGSVVGGLFGSHTSAARDPDIFNTQTYGQGIANLTGSLSANGQQFSESLGLQQSLGGDTELQAIAAYIAKTGGTGLTPQQLAEFKGVTSINPASLHSGNLTANTGEVQNWQTWINDVNAAMQTVTAGGGVPSFTMTSTYPNAGLAGGATTYPSTFSTGAGVSGIRHTQGAVVVADFSNATIIGPGGMDSAAVAIGQSLNRVATGQAAGAPQNSLSNLTFRGDF